MYRALGTVVYLSMSVDGSCRGLRSPRDGPVILELTQGTLLFKEYDELLLFHVISTVSRCNRVTLYDV
jgi:hypothetical protein